MTGRQAWKSVGMSGDCWNTEESVLFLIYTPVKTASLASKKVLYDEYRRPMLLAMVILPPSVALSVPYFLSIV